MLDAAIQENYKNNEEFKNCTVENLKDALVPPMLGLCENDFENFGKIITCIYATS